MFALGKRERSPLGHVGHATGGRCDACRRGFTLIEMLVVFSLLALLLSIAVPRFTAATKMAGEKARSQNMATVRDAIDKFRGDQGRYPTELAELVSRQYLRSIPIDPVTGSTNWTAITPPGTLEPGVYDVAPPGQQGDSQAGAGQAVASPR